MRRREFIFLIGAAAACAPAARAQPAARIARIGIVNDSPIWDPFREKLQQMGYVAGKNIAFEYRGSGGISNRLFAAADELARIPVDVIAVSGTPPAQAAQQATGKIPIVAIAVGDPVGAGLVSSFAHPDGNVTGNTILGTDIAAKRLQVLKDAIPSVSRVAYLWNPDNASSATALQQLLKAAPSLHLTLTSLEARTAGDFDSVFVQMASDRPDAVLTTLDPFHQTQMGRVIDFLRKSRIAGMFQTKQNVVDGGLMSYGANFPDLFRAGAIYVDKILHGSKPADLPVEEPVTFELVVNLKTAKAIGLALPPTLIARADEVVE